MKRILLLALLVTATASNSYPWGHQGHRTVAAIAYNQLTEDERNQITAILQYHPFYEEHWRPAYKTRHPQGMTFEEFAFIRAAGWPDDVRSEEFKDDYHNGTWHYVNFPVTPPNAPNTEEPIGTGLLLDQIDACRKSVKNHTSKSKREHRAIMLSWLLHLVGDLHQPLHTVALVNATYPDGDHGGNFFFVRRSSTAKGEKLHGFWDNIVGSSMEIGDAAKLADELVGMFAKTNQMVQGDFNDWANESAQLGLRSGYQFKGVSIPGGKSIKFAKTLPFGYVSAAREIAREQVALAGYRLAKMIKDILP
jgi:hypothetical protein